MKNYHILAVIGSILVIFSIVVFIQTDSLMLYLICLMLGYFGWIAAAAMYSDEKNNMPITKEELDKLSCLGREPNGSYSDRWDFILKPIRNKDSLPTGEWAFCFLDETGVRSDILIKRVKTMEELREVYRVISGKKLA